MKTIILLALLLISTSVFADNPMEDNNQCAALKLEQKWIETHPSRAGDPKIVWFDLALALKYHWEQCNNFVQISPNYTYQQKSVMLNMGNQLDQMLDAMSK